jgi:membrane-associated phospholipid phosphatase
MIVKVASTGKGFYRFTGIFLVAVFLLLAGGREGYSRNHFTPDSLFSFKSQKGYFPSLLHNFGEQASAPFRFNTNEWLIAYGSVYLTASLIYLDPNIDEWAGKQKERHAWVNRTSPFITDFGGNPAIGSVVAFGLLSAVFKYNKGLQTSLLATQAMITSGVWVRLIKILTGRERPFASYSHSHLPGGQWHGPLTQYTWERNSWQFNSSFDSFVSGHTATAFSIAAVIAEQYSDIRVVPYICYTAATLAGLSRLTEHQHWASDVFAGALIGYLCGRQVVRNFNRVHQIAPGMPVSRSKWKPALSIQPTGNQLGICLIF